MTLFWLAAALLLGTALVLLVAPWWRRRPMSDVDRDQRNVTVMRQRLKELEADRAAGLLSEGELEAARDELSRALARDLRPERATRQRRVARGASTAIVVLTVPMIAGSVYLVVGDPDALRNDSTTPAAVRPTTEAALPPVAEMVDKLALRLASDPNDAEGWLMLARSYMILERFGDAASAFARVRELSGDTAAVLAQHAGAIAMANGGDITDQAGELLEKALAADPLEPRGLWLSGIGARQRGDPVQALRYWRALEPLLVENREARENLEAMIADTERELADAGIDQPADRSDREASAPGEPAPEITVMVSVDQALADRVSPDDTVFVFARAAQGPPMPLAVARRQGRDLPLTVTLDDSMAMAPGVRLSAFDRVRIGARISRSGNALPQAGDLEGETGSVSPATTEPVQVVISDVVP